MKTKTMRKVWLAVLLFVMSTMLAAACFVGFGSHSVYAEDEKATIENVNVALNDGIIVNIHTTAATDDGSYLVVGFNGEEYTLTDNQNGVFSFYSVAPQQMGMNITAALYDSEDNKLDELSQDEAFSVKSYLMKLLGIVTPEAAGLSDEMQLAALKELCVDFLNYGAAAQTYKSYDTENLVNASLTSEQSALATGDITAESKKQLSENNTMWLGVNVRFDSRLGLLFAFKTDSDNTGSSSEVEGYTVTIGNDKVTPVWDRANGFWVVQKKYINITEMNTAVTATIHKTADGKNTENDQTYTYSLASYVNAKSASSTAGLSALVNTAYKFAYAAVAYSQVSYLEPTFTTAGYVRLPDAKGFDYSGTVYQAEELPILSVADYELSSTLNTEKSEGYSDTNPYIVDVYTLKTNALRSYAFTAENCINLGGNIYSPNTYRDAHITIPEVTVDYDDNEKTYTIACDDANLISMQSYGAKMVITGNVTLTRSATQWLNHDVFVGTSATLGNLTYVTTAEADGISLSNNCSFNVVNGTVKMTGTTKGKSAFCTSSTSTNYLNVSENGTVIIDDKYTCPFYSTNGGVNVDGGTMTSDGTGPLYCSTLSVVNGGALTTANGLFAKTKIIVGNKEKDAATLKVYGSYTYNKKAATVHAISMDIYGTFYVKTSSGDGITVSGLAPASDVTYTVRAGGTLAVENATSGGTGITSNYSGAARVLNIVNDGDIYVWNYWASFGAWTKKTIKVTGSGNVTYTAANLTATTLSNTGTNTTVTERPDYFTQFD